MLTCSRIVIISTLSPQLLSPPPYLFTSIGLGLTNLASTVGVIAAYPIAGPLTDWVSQYMRRRNGGIHEPEHRMLSLIFPFLICPPGLILFGYMVAQGRTFYLAAIGLGMQASGIVMVPSVVISYVLDAYPATGSEALVIINAVKNLVAYGVSSASTKWLLHQGLEKMFTQLAGVQWAILALALPLYLLGPWLRKITLAVV